MSVSWQTGEPPCGVELLIEYTYDGRIRRVVSVLDTYLLSHTNITRWSTLDDDRAAMAIGSLEKLARDLEHEEKTIQVCAATKFILVDIVSDDGDDLESRGEGLSLIEAIEKLTEAGNELQGD